MVDAAKDAAKQGEQPRPGGPATLEDLFGIRPQLHSQAGDSIEGIVARIAEQQQGAFLGRQHEDEPHHDREAGLVELSRIYVAQELAITVLVGTVESL